MANLFVNALGCFGRALTSGMLFVIAKGDGAFARAPGSGANIYVEAKVVSFELFWPNHIPMDFVKG